MSRPYTSLHTFHLAIRFGSLKKTAEHLNLTESAVSHQIKRLETQLGYALFYKSGRQLKATPEGDRLANQLAQPFDHIDQVIGSSQQTKAKTITIYCLPSLLEVWLLPKLLRFKKRQPRSELAIRYYFSAPDYLDEHCLRIGSHEAEDKTLYPLHRILSGETIAVCSPIYLSQHANLTEPESLIKADLLHDHAEQGWQDWFTRQTIRYNQPAQFIYEDFHLLKMATMAAQGVALCPAALIEAELASGKLVQLFEEKGNLGRYYGIEHNRYAQQNVRELVDYLLETE